MEVTGIVLGVFIALKKLVTVVLKLDIKKFKTDENYKNKIVNEREKH